MKPNRILWNNARGFPAPIANNEVRDLSDAAALAVMHFNAMLETLHLSHTHFLCISTLAYAVEV
jgi:hypothetical protein